MASLDSEVILAKRFHMLSKNYDNRPVIARRNTLPVMIRFFESQEREMRRYSLEAIHLLAQHPENVDLLSDNRGLVSGVYKLYKDTQRDDPELHRVASGILDCLEPVLQSRDPRKLETPTNNMVASSSGVNPLTDANDEDSFSMRRRARVARVLRGVGSDAIRTVVLEIPALEARRDNDLATMEDIFQTTRGVLSYSIFLENCHARLFMTCETNALQMILSDAGFESMVVRDDVVGQEVFGEGGGNGRSYYDGGHGAASTQPSYLRSLANSIYRTALVLRGGGSGNNGLETDTLATRVHKQREREQNGGSALDIISKSLSKWW